ncbi:MAG: electron transfer flavoprotein subunit beta/FixA family protein [Phycisphaerae bacterium]|nr:electron transfer flavoprotein subunit beta/FixA family protein [Phycisphaerae bacterium]
MRFVCVIKAVPDPRAGVKPLADGSGLDPAGLKFVIDPFDEFALELAIQTKEKRSAAGAQGDAITALAVGGTPATEVLRHALAMGCDRAVHVPDAAAPSSDELALARSAAAAIRAAQPDAALIFTGKQSIDNDAGEFGPALGECLDLPHLGAASAFDLSPDGQRFLARRRVPGGEDALDLRLPAVVTVDKGLVEPRRPALARLMKAKSLPIEVLSATSLGITGPAAPPIRLAPPPARSACVMLTGEPPDIARELVRRLRTEARAI